MRSLFLSSLLLVSSAASVAADFTSEQGFVWDVQDAVEGALNNGTIDAYDGAYVLDVNGVRYGTSGQQGSLVQDDRAVKLAEMAIGDLRVRRYVFVPKSGGDYARIVDVVVNLGAAPVALTLTLSGNLGSDGSTVMVANDSGDRTLGADDAWFTTDDVDGSGDPSLGHVIQGRAPRSRAIRTLLDRDNFSWAFEADVPAGGRVVLLTYAIQAQNQARAQTEAARLAERPTDALVGIEDLVPDIIN